MAVLLRLILRRYKDVAAGRVEILGERVLPIEHVVPSRTDRPVSAQGIGAREIEQSIAVHLGSRRFIYRIEARAARHDLGSQFPRAEGIAYRNAAVFLCSPLQQFPGRLIYRVLEGQLHACAQPAPGMLITELRPLDPR